MTNWQRLKFFGWYLLLGQVAVAVVESLPTRVGVLVYHTALYFSVLVALLVYRMAHPQKETR